MRKPQTFFELQSIQREHDSRNHTDIYTLPLFDKMNHYALHFAKYTSRLIPKRSDKEIIRELRRTYTDAFLISLSASNAMNMDLDMEMRKIFSISPENISEYVKENNRFTPNELREYSRDVLGISTGSIADTMEKRDHLDDVDSRGIITRSISEITEMILRGSYHIKYDIVSAALERRRKISELKIT